MSEAMREAFVKAGYQDTDDRLLKIAFEALNLPYPKRAQHVRSNLSSDLIWRLWEQSASPSPDNAIANLLHEAAERRAGRQASAAGLGQNCNDTHTAVAQAGTTSQDPRGDKPRGKTGAAHAGNDAHASHGRPGLSAAEKAAQREIRLRGKLHAVVATYSKLDEFRCNGVPLGKLTAGEARAWSRQTARGARFVDMVTAGLQPDMVIENAVTAEEANEYWARSGDVQ